MPDHIRIILSRLLTRYSTPGRTNFCTLFLMRADSDFDALIPDPAHCLAAWADRGSGLQSMPVDQAIGMLQAEHDPAIATVERGTLTDSESRRAQMTRVISFTIYQVATPDGQDEVQVDLYSRALHYSPKGDRIAHETWRTAEDGTWYSLYVPRNETDNELDNMDQWLS